MSIVLQGSTSGSVTLQEPAVAGTTVLTLPAVSGTVLTTGSSGQSIPKAALPTGSVLQVVQATSTTVDTTSNTGFVATSLSVSITPTSSSSKILLFSTATVGMDTLNIAKYAFARNGTIINDGGQGWGASYFQPTSTADSGVPWSETYLDSPATTSAITYAVYFGVDSGGPAFFNSRSASNAGRSVIIAMEIAG